MIQIKYENINFSHQVLGSAKESTQIKNFNFALNENKSIGIVGRSGAGKSTLLQLISGFYQANSGQIYLNGQRIDFTIKKELANFQRLFGLVFQFPEDQFVEPTAGKDIAFGPRNLGLGEFQIQSIVNDSLHSVGLSDAFSSRRVNSLSQGEQRRVAVAGVLAMAPKFLLLDEPTAGLDNMGKMEIIFALNKFKIEKKGGLIITSHDFDFLDQVVDSLVVIQDGECFEYEKNAAASSYAESAFQQNRNQIANVLKSKTKISHDDIETLLEKAVIRKRQPVSS